MKKTSLILVLFILTGSAPAAYAFTASYRQEILQNGNPMAEFNVVVSDGKVRAESTLGGIQTVMIQTEGEMFHYQPQNRAAIRLAQGAQPNLTKDLPNYMEYLQANQARLVGSEQVGEYLTDVYEFTDPVTQSPAKVWVWKEKNFPVQIDVESVQGTTRVVFSNVQIGVAVDPASFSLPPGTVIRDFSQMMAGDSPASPPAQESP